MQELIQKNEFLRAGDSLEQTEAALADLLAKKVYLEWGLAQIDGLTIDGNPAGVELLISKGPELLCDEIVAKIRAEIGLTEEERKNF